MTGTNTMSTMTPREITSELDKHIIGQSAAKRAVDPKGILNPGVLIDP